MKVEFQNSLGATEWRTLTRANLMKVAHSIQEAHPGHPLSHTVAVLERGLRSGRDKWTIQCTGHEPATEVPIDGQVLLFTSGPDKLGVDSTIFAFQDSDAVKAHWNGRNLTVELQPDEGEEARLIYDQDLRVVGARLAPRSAQPPARAKARRRRPSPRPKAGARRAGEGRRGGR